MPGRPLHTACRLPAASERSQVEGGAGRPGAGARGGRQLDTGTPHARARGHTATEDMMDHLSLVPYDGAGGADGGGGKYKECMRNHAAAMGGQAFDGCGEYMASSPDTLKCAACGCHRSFHRRASATAGGAFAAAALGGSCAPPPHAFFRPTPPLALPAPPVTPQQHFHHHHHHQAALQAFLPSVAVPMPAPPPHPPHLALPYHAVPNAAAAPPWLATRAGSETPPRADDFGIGLAPGGESGSGGFGRKRFRTKFTPEQKERMREFAERQGWRINRNDHGALDRFCDEIGVKRQVLKVWMHNHKNQLASTSPTSAVAAAAATAKGLGIGIGINPSSAGTGVGVGVGVTGDGEDDDDDDDTDDSPPRAAVSSPSPSPISV